MTRDELLDQLYVARRQITAFISNARSHTDESESVDALVTAREQLVWHINRINMSELTASVAQITQVCEQVDGSTKRLTELDAKSEHIAKALDIAVKIVGAASTIVTKL